MIPFIYSMSMAILVVLLFSFYFKIYALSMISSMGMMAIGVFVSVNGAEGINTLMTNTYAIVFICVGAYILIKGTIEKTQEVM